MDRAELLIAWAHGWAVSRGCPLPQPVPGGVRIRLGHAERHVTTSVPDWVGDAGTPFGTEIKVLAPLETLDGRWLRFPAVELMTSGFARGAVTLPRGHTSRLEPDGASIVATVLDRDGAEVCSARLAPAGGFGIIDKVDTVPAHQRRGLATAALALLGNRAADAGLRHGILAATGMGAPLYRRLGWSSHGPIAGAIFKRALS